MYSSVVRRLILLCAMLALPAMAFAQEAVLTGTITDSTGAVLPGVTVQAVNEASGNNYEAVTDATRRLPHPGPRRGVQDHREARRLRRRDAHRCSTARRADHHAESSDGAIDAAGNGYGHRRGAADRNAVVGAGGNIDPRQVQDLPSAGRNWMSLALLAPGNRTNAAGRAARAGPRRRARVPAQRRWAAGTANLGTGNQARYSNDAIAEFQFISNRFDATQGRSSGVQVNAVTKSGTNQLNGTFVGNFRDSRWNAADPVLISVLPVQEPAVQRHDRRTDHPQQAALLRQLRVRAPTADLDLDDAVPGVQRDGERHCTMCTCRASVWTRSSRRRCA